MKKLTTIFALALTLAATGQESIGFQITQDVKLATFSNDKYGNQPFTTDMQIKVVLQGNDTDLGYLVVAPKYEYADLAGGAYQRYGFEAGYSFHTHLLGIDLTPLIGWGYSHRYGSRWENFEVSAEMKVPIIKNLSGIALMNYNQRKDLPNQKWQYNVGIGLRYDISTAWKAGSRF